MIEGIFTRFAKWASRATGHPASFMLGVAAIVVWAAVGPHFKYSDTWQLVINTSTTIVTFLMVFLIQNTQTRDTVAMQVKLDELIRAVEGAHNRLMDLEEMDDRQLDQIKKQYQAIAEAAKDAADEVAEMGSPPLSKVEEGPSVK